LGVPGELEEAQFSDWRLLQM